MEGLYREEREVFRALSPKEEFYDAQPHSCAFLLMLMSLAIRDATACQSNLKP